MSCIFRMIGIFLLLFSFINVQIFGSPMVFAESQTDSLGLLLPSETYFPPILKGIAIHPNDFLKFDFFIESGDEILDEAQLQSQTDRFIKYFLTSLAIPDQEKWVNLSPYEKNRIVPMSLGQTQMGKDLLEQDYLLKQMAASLMSPQHKIGKSFWHDIKKRNDKEFAKVSSDFFNKVWIVPETVNIVIRDSAAFISDATLKVMFEEDYLALAMNKGRINHGLGGVQAQDFYKMSSNEQRLLEKILPIIEKEVNEGRTFANLRQIYHAMILASWYKKTLQNSLLGKYYADSNKVRPLATITKEEISHIYGKYEEMFRHGVFDLIVEDYDPETQSMQTTRYFSGGINTETISSAMSQDQATINTNGELTKTATALDFDSPLLRNLNDLLIQGENFLTTASRDVRSTLGMLAKASQIANYLNFTEEERALLEIVMSFMDASQVAPEMPEELLARLESLEQVVDFKGKGFIDRSGQRKAINKISADGFGLKVLASLLDMFGTQEWTISDLKAVTVDLGIEMVNQKLQEISQLDIKASVQALQTSIPNEHKRTKLIETLQKVKSLAESQFELTRADEELIITKLAHEVASIERVQDMGIQLPGALFGMIAASHKAQTFGVFQKLFDDNQLSDSGVTADSLFRVHSVMRVAMALYQSDPTISPKAFDETPAQTFFGRIIPHQYMNEQIDSQVVVQIGEAFGLDATQLQEAITKIDLVKGNQESLSDYESWVAAQEFPETQQTTPSSLNSKEAIVSKIREYGVLAGLHDPTVDQSIVYAATLARNNVIPEFAKTQALASYHESFTADLSASSQAASLEAVEESVLSGANIIISDELIPQNVIEGARAKARELERDIVVISGINVSSEQTVEDMIQTVQTAVENGADGIKIKPYFKPISQNDRQIYSAQDILNRNQELITLIRNEYPDLLIGGAGGVKQAYPELDFVGMGVDRAQAQVDSLIEVQKRMSEAYFAKSMIVKKEKFEYDGQEWEPTETGELELSEGYKKRFLPLVNPNHSEVPKNWKGDPNISLIARISGEVLFKNRAFQEMIDDLENSEILSDKVSIMDRGKFHFSFNGFRNRFKNGVNNASVEEIQEFVQELAEQIGDASAFRINIEGGIWLNNFIPGRGFLKIYPEFLSEVAKNGAEDILGRIGAPFRGTHPAGFLQLMDGLSRVETQELLRIIDKHLNDIFVEGLLIDQLVLVRHQDDLLGEFEDLHTFSLETSKSQVGGIDLNPENINFTIDGKIDYAIEVYPNTVPDFEHMIINYLGTEVVQMPAMSVR